MGFFYMQALDGHGANQIMVVKNGWCVMGAGCRAQSLKFKGVDARRMGSPLNASGAGGLAHDSAFGIGVHGHPPHGLLFQWIPLEKRKVWVE